MMAELEHHSTVEDVVMRRTASYNRNPPNATRRPPRRHFLTVERLQAVVDKSLHDDGPQGDLNLMEILEIALSQAASRCDRALTDYILSLGEPRFIALIDSLAVSWRSEDGNDLVSAAVIASAGREEKEEVVRAFVKRWGPRSTTPQSSETSPWSPLHFAALLSTPPLISFLLNQGYPPSATTARGGLSALDLISDMPHRQEAVVLLRHAEQALLDEGHNEPAAHVDDRRQRLLDRRRANKLAADELVLERARRAERRAAKDAWVVEQMRAAGMDDQGVKYLLSGGGVRKGYRLGYDDNDGDDSGTTLSSDSSDDDDDDNEDNDDEHYDRLSTSDPPGSATPAGGMTIFDEIHA